MLENMAYTEYLTLFTCFLTWPLKSGFPSLFEFAPAMLSFVHGYGIDQLEGQFPHQGNPQLIKPRTGGLWF